MDRREILTGAAVLAASAALPARASAADAPGISAKEIVLGGVMPITGPVRLASEPYELGIRSVFDSVNAEGGINGRKITWKIEDDAYQPNRAVAGAKKQVERDGVFMIFGQHGTPTGFSIAPYLEQVHVPMMMTTAGPTPLKKYTFGGLAPYSAVVYRLADYLIKQGGYKKIGYLYQNDDVGETARIGLNKAMKENGTELVADVGFERGATDFSTQILKLRDSNADAVVVMTTGPTFASIVKAADGLGVHPVWSTYSVASISAVRELLGTNVNGVIYASEIESPFSDEPGVVQCRQTLAKYYPKVKPDWGSLLGYAHARLLVGVLKAMGADLTRDGLVAALEKTKGVEVGTMAPMGFSPTNHNGATAVRIFRYEDQKPVAKTGWLDVSHFTPE